MGIRSAFRSDAACSNTDDTLTSRDIAIAKALMIVHGATVVFGLAVGGWFLVLAAFGAVMAAAIGYVVFSRPRSQPVTALPELQPES